MRALSDQLQVELVNTYICGLIITKNAGGNTLDISAGNCYDPSSGRIIVYAGATAVNAGTLGATQWNQVYLYDSSGTATVEVVNNATPPSTTYAGTARQGGTGSNRRWIGSFQTDGSSNIVAHVPLEIGHGAVHVQRGSQFAALSNGTSTTYAAVSLTNGVVRYATTTADFDVALGYSTTAANSLQCQISPDGGTTDSYRVRQYVEAVGSTPRTTHAILIDNSSPQIHYKATVIGTGSGPQVSINVLGYTHTR